MMRLLVLTAVIAFCFTAHAAHTDRFIMKLKLPSGQTAVVAEGEFEARSIGSFSVRLYDAAPTRDETTFFSSGLIRSRDGIIENVVLADIDTNQLPEIIVIVRSVGTGSYVSAHAFAYDKKALIFLASVKNLPPGANPITALQHSISRLK